MSEPSKGGLWSFVRLARPHQWLKGVFVLIGPLYVLRDLTAKQHELWWQPVMAGLLAFAAFGFASSACIAPTNHDYDAGRRSGLWNIAAKLPLIAGHTSPFMVALTLLGTLALLSLAFANQPRRRLVLLAAVIGYIAASTANHDLFQRYVDPFALMILALMTPSATPLPPRIARFLPAGPLVLAWALIAVTFNSLRNSDHIDAPPPAASQPGEPPTPAELPRPLEPPNHHFWPW